MTRNQLDFLVVALIALFVLWGLVELLDWIEHHYRYRAKPNRQLMKELDRHSGKDDTHGHAT